jgi:hypothetical protein
MAYRLSSVVRFFDFCNFEQNVLMQKFILLIMALYYVQAQAQTSMLSYVGGSGRDAFYDVTQISNGTFLVCGSSNNLSWIPTGTPTTILSASGIANAADTNNAFGFILNLSNDMQNILSIVRFPQGAVANIKFMKFTSMPYASTTGDMYISGTTYDTRANGGGYFLAKLNNNFVAGLPTATSWVKSVWAEGAVFNNQPWDVGNDGKVVYIYGQTNAADWGQISRLQVNGVEDIVDNWRLHWDNTGAEYKDIAANYTGPNTLVRSGITFKNAGRCDLRSTNAADFNMWQPDGNGSMRKGKWPMDFLYASHCVNGAVSTSGPGYNGYKVNNAVYGGSAVVVDRRNNYMYFGMNTKSILPGGLPDFEPAVWAMDNTGTLLWYSRLYHEVMPNSPNDTVQSTPDQYVDGLAIDYASDMLVVDARCHGNNISNFWKGNAIVKDPTRTAFQNQFTGSNGNIHISWLGKLAIASGELEHATYVAEYNQNQNAGQTPLTQPNMGTWPSPNAGWPNVNTTRIAPGTLKVASDGAVLIGAVGRHAMTTADAYQKNILPTTSGSVSAWSQFVRLYEPNFTLPRYSSLMVGQFDTLTGLGGDNTDVFGYYKGTQGIVGVGRHRATAGIPSGAVVPTANVVPWGSAAPNAESAIIFYYQSANMLNLADSQYNFASPLSVNNTIQLQGYDADNAHKLFWNTSNSVQVLTYDVQSSVDGNAYHTLASLSANENATAYVINNPQDGATTYRIAQHTTDGTSVLSNAIKLYYHNPSGLSIYPNPAKNEVYINLVDTDIDYKLIDMRGEVVLFGKVTDQRINLQAMPPGNYALRLATTSGSWSRRIEVK